MRSRRDLRRVNRVLGTHPILLRALDACVRSRPLRLIELGAGDGRVLLGIARKRYRRWPDTSVRLVDRQALTSTETLNEIRRLGWSAEAITADALEWLEASSDAGDDTADAVFLANLFIHHLEGARLERLLAGIARRGRAFVCCEPRRSIPALAGSRLLGLIGCSAVTRHDAVVSVRGGFSDAELSSIWMNGGARRSSEWRVQERRAGPFSHLFVAVRR